MPKKKPSEQEQMNQAFQKSTGMKVINQQQPEQGKTEFAKDTYKDGKPIPANPSGK